MISYLIKRETFTAPGKNLYNKNSVAGNSVSCLVINLTV